MQDLVHNPPAKTISNQSTYSSEIIAKIEAPKLSESAEILIDISDHSLSDSYEGTLKSISIFYASK